MEQQEDDSGSATIPHPVPWQFPDRHEWVPAHAVMPTKVKPKKTPNMDRFMT